jgi:hypothetical protein
MVSRMKKDLTRHIDENSKTMYEAAKKKLIALEKAMRSSISSKFTDASKEARQKLNDDIMLVLQDEVFDKANPRMRAARKNLQKQLIEETENIDSAWKSVLVDPVNQLRARNNFEINGDSGDDEDDSDIDNSPEVDESESEDEDFTDSEDEEE